MLYCKFHRFFNATHTIQNWLWTYSAFQSLHKIFFSARPCLDIQYLFTKWTRQTRLTSSQAALHEIWLVTCFPCTPETTVQGNCLWCNFNFCQWKFLSIFLYNGKFNVNIEFLKIATLEPILSRETGFWFCSKPVDNRV